MTPNQAREAIYEAFKSGWGTLTPYSFDNEPFVPPAKTDCWVRLSVRHSVAQQETMGAPGFRKFESKGTIFVQVFVPRGTAKATADAKVIALQGVIADTRLSADIVCYSAIPREMGVAAGDTWDQTSVEIPFTYYDTR